MTTIINPTSPLPDALAPKIIKATAMPKFEGKMLGRLLTNEKELRDRKHGGGLFATSDYSNRAFPFRVEFIVKMEEEQDVGWERTYFVRCKKDNKGQAAVIAAMVWKQWEKLAVGGADDFCRCPMVVGPARSTVLDEGDWKEYWRDAQKWPRKFAGHKDNPVVFTYMPDKEFTDKYVEPSMHDFYRDVSSEEDIHAGE